MDVAELLRSKYEIRCSHRYYQLHPFHLHPISDHRAATALSKAKRAKRTIKIIVKLKTRRSIPRRVLNTEPALLPPKALPRPALRVCNNTKRITATLKMMPTILSAGSHC